jgi:transposase
MEIKILLKQGFSVRQIAKKLDLSRNTVRRYLRVDEMPHYERKQAIPSKLDPYKSYLLERFKAMAPRRLSASVAHREISEKGYNGGLTILRNFIRSEFEPKQPAVIRFETSAGKQMQVDWTIMQRGNPRLEAFVAVLGYSRRAYVEFVQDEKEETLLACHHNAFEYFGGITQEILYDNMKTVVIERDRYGEGKHGLQKTFYDFAKHYGFIPRLCRPYRAQTKGKVERFNRYLKDNFYYPLASKNEGLHPTLLLKQVNIIYFAYFKNTIQ